jgi:integrase
LIAAYLDHLRRVRGLEPKTCEGQLVAARRVLAWYDAHVPGQPIATMTGEHVHVDLIGGALHIRKTKFRKDRLVPIHPTTLTVLSNYDRHRNAVFPVPKDSAFFLSSRGNRLSPPGLYAAFDAACELAGLGGDKGLRPHDLRHRFAVTRLAVWHQEKADVQALLPLLATYLGHARYTDTAYYASSIADVAINACSRAAAVQR